MEKGLEIVASCLHPVRYDDAIPDSLYNAIKGSLKEQLNYMVLLLVDLKRNSGDSKYLNNELKRVSKEVALFMEGNYSTDLSHSNVYEVDVRFAFENVSVKAMSYVPEKWSDLRINRLEYRDKVQSALGIDTKRTGLKNSIDNLKNQKAGKTATNVVNNMARKSKSR